MRHRIADWLEAVANRVRPSVRGHFDAAEMRDVMAEHNKALQQIIEWGYREDDAA